MRPIAHLILIQASLLTFVAGFSQANMPEPGPVFRDDVIPKVFIYLPPDSLEKLLAFGNEYLDHHYKATFVFDNGEVRDTVDHIGFRLRGKSSRYADKKSFKISFNTYQRGRKFYGLEKMNLNGEHYDPSLARSKIAWDLLRAANLPGSRANHVELYINAKYFGLYANIEHIDEEFVKSRFGNKDGNLYKCLYPARLVYQGDDPDLYKIEYLGERYYELKTNELEDDYSDLAHFIDVLSNTTIEERPCSLEKVFNVNAFLKYMVFDILTGNWDDPLFNKNNFYLYYNTASCKFEYLSYDLDNTLGIDLRGIDWGERNIYEWGDRDQVRPLYDRIMEIPVFRERFSFYMEHFLNEYFSEEQLFNPIDNLRSKLRDAAQRDSFRMLDYGFTFQDFLDAYDQNLENYEHVAYDLKSFISTRRLSAFAQLEFPNIAPIIEDIKVNYADENQPIEVKARILDDSEITKVELCYQFADQTEISCLEMLPDDLPGNSALTNTIFSGVVSPPGRSTMFSYFISAFDDSGKSSKTPFCDFQEVFIGTSQLPIHINEVMAKNEHTIADELGEYDDWIELYNSGQTPVYLGDKYLSDNPSQPNKWAIPGITIQPGEFLLFWADDEKEQGLFHANFKLASDGETIGIYHNETYHYQPIDTVHYPALGLDESFGQFPDGSGLLKSMSPSPRASNVSFSTSEKDLATGLSLRLFPNPFQEELSIQIDGAPTGSLFLEIRDAFGRQVHAAELSPHEQKIHTWNAKGAPAGIYIVHVRVANNSKTVKVVLSGN